MSPPPPRLPEARRFFKAMLAAVSVRSLYPEGHPVSSAALREVATALGDALGDGDELAVGSVGASLVLGGMAVPGGDTVLERFRGELEVRGVEKLVFGRTATEEGLSLVAGALGMTPEALRAAGGMEALLARSGLGGIRTGRLSVEEAAISRDPSGDWEEARGAYRRGLEAVQEISETLRRGRAVSVAEVREITSLLIEGVQSRRSPMLAALALRRKSPYTFSHALNVSLLVLAQVDAAGLPGRMLEQVAAAGLLHDVGKLTLPGEILEKPGPLTDEEWEVLRRHPVLGAETLRRMPDVGVPAVLVAFEHHRRFDGTGYPETRRPRPQATLTQLTAIADCYDAMRSSRPYSPGEPCEVVYSHMAGLSGTAFHPGLLARFFKLVGRFPPGTTVRLSTGATARVVRNHPAWDDRPVVELLQDEAGSLLPPGALLDLSLEAERPDGSGCGIRESLPETS